MQVQPHTPRYVYCSDPDVCCFTDHPVAIECAVDGQHWPCGTKRSHHTEAQVRRIRRWALGRTHRPAVSVVRSVNTPLG